MSKVQFNILLNTSQYRGDHTADVSVAHEVLPGETVEQLVERLLGNTDEFDKSAYHARDVIEIRRIVEAKDLKKDN